MVRAVRCCQPYLPLSTPARLHTPPPVNLRRSSAFPAPRYLLTSAVWSIGAYGQGAWVNSQPQGDHTGQSVNMVDEHSRRRVGSYLGGGGGGGGASSLGHTG